MHVVIDQRLWIGNARDARDPRVLYDHAIAAVVDLAYDEPPAVLPRDIIYCRFPLVDGGGNDRQLLKLAIDTVARLIADETPTLVACSAGMSRSPCIAAMAAAQHLGKPAEVVLTTLTANHPHDVSLTLWQDAMQACAAI